MSSDLSGIFEFFYFLRKGREGEREWEEANVNWGFWGLQVTSKLEEGGDSIGGIKVEFGGFIGGFGKIFFTNGGIKRKGMGFLEGWEGKFIFF